MSFFAHTQKIQKGPFMWEAYFNSNLIKLQSSLGLICTYFRSDLFSAESQKENKDLKFNDNFNIRRQFQH